MTDAHLPGAITLPDGRWIRGRGLGRPTPPGPLPHYGLYLGSPRMRAKYDENLTWPHDWIDWPDFRLPRDPEAAIRQIRALHERTSRDTYTEVACGGGIGRTGTVMACLAILAGTAPAEAVAWTRANYHPRAVETPGQRTWVSRFPTDNQQ